MIVPLLRVGLFCAHIPYSNVKTFLIALVVLTFLIVFTPEAHALFGHVQVEKERRQEAEQRVVQEQHSNGDLISSNQCLHVVITVLSTGVITALIVGAAIGSKTRKDHDANL